jgi:hypothetical protein
VVASLTVRLGVRFAAVCVDAPPPVVLSITCLNTEFNPDDVFLACNRIDDVEVDVNHLVGWQRELRRLLDHHQAPSMSPGDSFDVTSDAGRHVGSWVCDSFGWHVENQGAEL